MNDLQNIQSRITTFLNSIEIPVMEEKLTHEAFLPELMLKGNTMLIDSEKLKYPGDLLHEAGHI